MEETVRIDRALTARNGVRISRAGGKIVVQENAPAESSSGDPA
jgi:hypothetical protein